MTMSDKNIEKSESKDKDKKVNTDTDSIKTKVIHTSLWVAYFIVGVIITIVAMTVQKSVSIDFSVGEILKMILMFLCISAEKYIGFIAIVGVYFAIKRKDYPKYFAFIFGFYTMMLILCVIGVFII